MGIMWMGQAQAAVFTGSAGSAAPASDVGIAWFLGVATEPRGHLDCRRTGWQACQLGLSPYLGERVQHRTSFRGPALRAKSSRRQCCMTPPAPPPPPASRAPLPRPPSPEPIDVTIK